MRAGRLDEPIEWRQVRVVTDSTTGEALEQFVEAGTDWAELLEETGSESEGLAERIALAGARIKVRWRSDLDVRWRFLLRGREYQITSIKPLGRRDALEVTGEARAEPAA